MGVITGSLAAAAGIKALIAKLGMGAAAKGAATQLTIPGLAAASKVAAGQGARMAGSGAFKSGLGRALFGEMGAGQIAARLAPDVAFGGLSAVMTPGDLGDKLIAGSTQAIGGGLGGIALGRAAGGISPGLGLAADLVGSYGGDVAGMAVGDKLQRGKDKLMGGEGRTAYERMSDEQQRQLAEQIRQQTLMGAGLIPGMQDQYTSGFGLS